MIKNYLASIKRIFLKTKFFFLNSLFGNLLKSYRLKIGIALLVSTSLGSSCSNTEQSKSEEKEKPEERIITCYAAQFEDNTIIKDTTVN
jgi:hypothetical protein